MVNRKRVFPVGLGGGEPVRSNVLEFAKVATVITSTST
jgi:hypothetical protein